MSCFCCISSLFPREPLFEPLFKPLASEARDEEEELQKAEPPKKNEGYALKLLSWAEFRSEIGKPLSGVTAVGIVSNPNVKVMVRYRGGEIFETFYTVGALCGIGIYYLYQAKAITPATGHNREVRRKGSIAF